MRFSDLVIMVLVLVLWEGPPHRGMIYMLSHGEVLGQPHSQVINAVRRSYVVSLDRKLLKAVWDLTQYLYSRKAYIIIINFVINCLRIK